MTLNGVGEAPVRRIGNAPRFFAVVEVTADGRTPALSAERPVDSRRRRIDQRPWLAAVTANKLAQLGATSSAALGSRSLAQSRLGQRKSNNRGNRRASS